MHKLLFFLLVFLFSCSCSNKSLENKTETIKHDTIKLISLDREHLTKLWRIGYIQGDNNRVTCSSDSGFFLQMKKDSLEITNLLK